jgi:leader peptidase (prepilin peptidase) / N-methyltransferase
MKVIYYIIFIISGLIIGNFLNVLIYRLPRSISLRRPTSFCPECGGKIAFYESIPLISYFFLKGRCRNCGKPIPLKYPIVESLCAVLFFLNYYFFGISLLTLLGIIFCSILLAVTFIDIEFKLIPDILILPFSIIGLAIHIIYRPTAWWIVLASAFGAFAFMLIVHLIYPKGMGMGDVKFSFMAGAFLSRNVIVGLFFSFVLGAFFGLIMLLFKKSKLKNSIAFGPFISLGSIIALFYGNEIINWYLGMF